MMRRISLILMAAMLFGSPGRAIAQDTVVISANAEIALPARPVSITVDRNLSFGTVGLPTVGSLTGIFICSYEVTYRFDGVVVFRIGDGGAGDIYSPGDGLVVTPDGCSFDASVVTAGQVTVSCEPGTTVNIDISFNQGTSSGTYFTLGRSNIGVPGSSLIFGSPVCPSGGTFPMQVGGNLQVNEYADRSSGEEHVGSVILTANY